MEIHGEATTYHSKQPPLTRQRIVLFPLPFQGHINPMLQIASILHTRGFKITIIHTEYNSPNYSNYPHFAFKSISDGSYSKLRESTSLSQPFEFYLTYLNENCLEPFRDCLGALLAEPDEAPVACIITDAIWYFTQAVANDLKLPRIVLRATSLACLLVYSRVPLFLKNGYFNIRKQDLQYEELVPEFPLLKGKDMERISNNPQGMSILMSNIIEQTKRASGIISNTVQELEQPILETLCQEFPTPIFTFPFHKYFSASTSTLLEQDRSIMSWLNSKPLNSVLYASFGSATRISESKFQEVAHGLANSMMSFLWVVRPGSVHGSEWLESLPEMFLQEVGDRGCIVKWAPQQEVLAHEAIGCFWTHNGWNSTLESICEGVPMICSPSFSDQPINARYVSDVWKIGCLLEKGLERVEIGRAIKRIMVDKEGQEMQERINCLKSKISLSIEEGGSSQQSLDRLVNYLLLL